MCFSDGSAATTCSTMKYPASSRTVVPGVQRPPYVTCPPTQVLDAVPQASTSATTSSSSRSLGIGFEVPRAPPLLPPPRPAGLTPSGPPSSCQAASSFGSSTYEPLLECLSSELHSLRMAPFVGAPGRQIVASARPLFTTSIRNRTRRASVPTSSAATTAATLRPLMRGRTPPAFPPRPASSKRLFASTPVVCRGF